MNSAALALASMDELSGWLWRANWQSAVLAALVLLVVALAGRRIAPKWRYALWLLVVVRLCLPMLPSSSWSVFNLVRGSEDASVDSVASGEHADGLSVVVEYGRAPDSIPSNSRAQARGASWFVVHWRGALTCIWMSSAALFGLVILLAHLRLSRRVRRVSNRVEDEAVIDLLERCRREMGVRGSVAMYASDAVGSPALFGVRRPMVLLPRDMLGLDRAALRFVLLHEMAHVKRRDVLMNWLLTAVAAIHWLNPLTHYVVDRCRQERELICDGMVLDVVGEAQGRAYGRTLIDLFERLVGEPSPALAVGLFGRRSLISRRIDMISRTSSNRRRGSVVAMLLLAGIAGATLTDARVAPPAESAGALPALEKAQDPAKPGDVVTMVYDIRDLIEQLQHAASGAQGVPMLSDIPIVSLLYRTNAKYIVCEGDTLPSIAAMFYGDERQADVIAKLNGLMSKDLIKPGQVLVLPGVSAAQSDAAARGETSNKAASTLMATLRERMASGDGSSPAPTMAIDPRNGTLMATMSPPAHEHLASLLANLREKDLVEVEARFITGLDTVIASGNVKLDLPGQQAAGRVRVVQLTADNIKFITKSSQDGKASLLASPRVMVAEGQNASVSIMSKAEIAVPDADGQGGMTAFKVDEGISVDVMAEVSEDRKTVTLRLHPSWSSLSQVKPLPIVQQAEAIITIAIADGGAALIELKGASLALIAAQRAQGEGTGGEVLPVLTRDDAGEAAPLFILVSPRVILAQQPDATAKPVDPRK